MAAVRDAVLERTPLAVALDLAANGIPVFPVNPTNKRPLTQRGFKDASTDRHVIEEWWRNHPRAMLGVPTGRTSSSPAIGRESGFLLNRLDCAAT
jgi:hypothetical protein